MLALIGMAVTSCDDHHPVIDTSMKVGDILCTDGQTLSFSEWKKSGKEGIGIVFHINRDTTIAGSGYAVYMNDLQPKLFADSLGVKQNTSSDIMAYDGNQNTYAIMSAKDVKSEMADAVFEMWKYGQSAYIPSVAQMRLLHLSRSAVNPLLASIGGEPITDEADGCWYWTSTEVSGQEASKAWLYSLSQGTMQETPKNQAHKVRPIITIYK